MKKILPFICFALAACSGQPEIKPDPSADIEKAALDCWSQNWTHEKNYDITAGIKLVDNYLFAHGYLGKRTPDDYRKFFTDPETVSIPDSVPGSDKMLLALNSDFGATPNVQGMIACWKTSWFEKMNMLDSNNVIYRTGKLVKALAETGPPDVNIAAQEFFKNLTQEEMDRPLIKNIAYFIFWKSSNGQTHIIISHPDVMSNDTTSGKKY